VRSHIDWRREFGTSASVAKTLGLKGGWIMKIGEENETFFYKREKTKKEKKKT